MTESATTSRAKSTARSAKATAESAKGQSKALLSRFTDAGEEALQRLADLPGGHRALGAINELRNRVDELGKKVRGIDELERRIARLEKQVAQLRPARRSTSTRSSARKPKPPAPPTS